MNAETSGFGVITKFYDYMNRDQIAIKINEGMALSFTLITNRGKPINVIVL